MDVTHLSAPAFRTRTGWSAVYSDSSGIPAKMSFFVYSELGLWTTNIYLD